MINASWYIPNRNIHYNITSKYEASVHLDLNTEVLQLLDNNQDGRLKGIKSIVDLTVLCSIADVCNWH